MSSINLPKSTMYDDDILYYARILDILNFRGVKMRDELPLKTSSQECGVVNLKPHTVQGSHWTAWFKDGKQRYYFDSFGERPPVELERYLKSDKELKADQPAIRRSAVTVQHDTSKECGALCLYVLYRLSRGEPFARIIKDLQDRYLKRKTSPLVIKTATYPRPLSLVTQQP